MVAIVVSCGTRVPRPSQQAHPHLVNAPLAPKWPPAVGQCGQVGVAEFFIIFLCVCCCCCFIFSPFFCTLRLLCFGSCPFLRLRHSRLFISNFISYEFVCFYRKKKGPQPQSPAAEYKQNKRARPIRLQLLQPQLQLLLLLHLWPISLAALKGYPFVVVVVVVFSSQMNVIYIFNNESDYHRSQFRFSSVLKTFKFKYFSMP